MLFFVGEVSGIDSVYVSLYLPLTCHWVGCLLFVGKIIVFLAK